jgi:hypothetical protein
MHLRRRTVTVPNRAGTMCASGALAIVVPGRRKLTAYSVGPPAILSIGFRTIRIPSQAGNALASRAIMICNHQ